MKNKIKWLTKRILPIVAVLVIVTTMVVPCFASDVPIDNSYVPAMIGLNGIWSENGYIPSCYDESVIVGEGKQVIYNYMGDASADLGELYVEVYAHDFYANCVGGYLNFAMLVDGVGVDTLYVVKYSILGSNEVIEESGESGIITLKCDGQVYVHELYLYREVESLYSFGYAVPKAFYYRNNEFVNDSEVNTEGVYQGIYNIINTHVFGGLAVEGTVYELVTMVVSIIACLFLVALPFLLVFLIIRLMRG